MNDLDKLIQLDNDSVLLNELKSFRVEIGNFELDILAIRKSNNEIIMLDHDSPDFEMGNCAKDIRSFLNALKGFINFMLACEENEELYDDYKQMGIVAQDSSIIAGSPDYLWFYQMMFGI